MKVGIIGSGIMGTCIGYFLSKRGIDVEIFEASPELGGLAGPLTLDDGTVVDRFYHAILSNDSHLRELCEDLGIADQFRFHETRMGFFYQGKIYSMNNVMEFLRFPPLGWIDRFRLGLTVLSAQFVRDWHRLESISVERWLVRLGGSRVFKNIWLPMLKAKFDGSFDNTPATYIWSRLVRMKSTRRGANQKEEAGHLIGGYSSMIRAMADRIRAVGGIIHLRSPISKIEIEQNEARGLVIDGEIHPFDLIIATVQPPILPFLIPDASSEYRTFLAQTQYLGIVCPIMILDRSLTGYWTLNITDERIPFTGIIETTSYIDPQYVGGHHLIYLPKYTAPDSPLQKMSDDKVKEIWLGELESMLPQFDRSWIRYFLVQRARYVEPLHPLKGLDMIPPVNTPIKNLYLATNAQIYPALTNGESISRKAREVSELIMVEIQGQAKISFSRGMNHDQKETFG
jgi:protoporphyrinogen oxidase